MSLTRLCSKYLRLGIAGSAITAAMYCGLDIYNAYDASCRPSKFELAAQRLGLTYEQADSLLRIFYIAGYLTPENLWADTNRIGGIKDPEQTFQSIHKALLMSGALDEQYEHFEPTLLRKHLFKTDLVTEQDVADLVLYIAQHAFNRQIGQERNELQQQNWMERYKDEYMQAAQTLGLIDPIEPDHTIQYDEAWVLGASRVGALARIAQYQHMLVSGTKVVGPTRVLAGNRELWAEMDGINPELLQSITDAMTAGKSINEIDAVLPTTSDDIRLAEGKEYLVSLAQANGIRYSSDTLFVVCNSKEDCKPGRMPGRHYLNSERPLTETMMTRALLQTFLPNAQIVDTQGVSNQRPDTATTARDAIVELLKTAHHDNQKHILLISNNPYIKRQGLVTEREIAKALKENELHKELIVLHPVGFGLAQDLPPVHSELGALFTELWKNTNSTRDPKVLMFQTRTYDPVPSMPSKVHLTMHDKIVACFSRLSGDHLEYNDGC